MDEISITLKGRNLEDKISGLLSHNINPLALDKRLKNDFLDTFLNIDNTGKNCYADIILKNTETNPQPQQETKITFEDAVKKNYEKLTDGEKKIINTFFETKDPTVIPAELSKKIKGFMDGEKGKKTVSFEEVIKKNDENLTDDEKKIINTFFETKDPTVIPAELSKKIKGFTEEKKKEGEGEKKVRFHFLASPEDYEKEGIKLEPSAMFPGRSQAKLPNGSRLFVDEKGIRTYVPMGVKPFEKEPKGLWNSIKSAVNTTITVGANLLGHKTIKSIVEEKERLWEEEKTFKKEKDIVDKINNITKLLNEEREKKREKRDDKEIEGLQNQLTLLEKIIKLENEKVKLEQEKIKNSNFELDKLRNNIIGYINKIIKISNEGSDDVQEKIKENKNLRTLQTEHSNDLSVKEQLEKQIKENEREIYKKTLEEVNKMEKTLNEMKNNYYAKMKKDEPHKKDEHHNKPTQPYVGPPTRDPANPYLPPIYTKSKEEITRDVPTILPISSHPPVEVATHPQLKTKLREPSPMSDSLRIPDVVYDLTRPIKETRPSGVDETKVDRKKTEKLKSILKPKTIRFAEKPKTVGLGDVSP